MATARTPATVVPLMSHAYTCADLVVMTGAALWSRPQHRFSEIKLIPEKDVLSMFEVFCRANFHPFWYTLGDDSHLEVFSGSKILTPPEERFVAERQGLELKTFHLRQQCPGELFDRTVLFFGMGTKKQIISVASRLSEISECYVSYYKDTYNDNLWLLEVFAPGVSKAEGIKRLREKTGAERLVVFGDNLNDIPMMREADLAVAVANALPQTKAAADIVIGPNTDDSVVKFILEDYCG